MDLNELSTIQAHTEGAEMQVINPNTGEKTDVFIRFFGPDSIEYRKQFKRQTSTYVKAMKDETPVDDFEVNIDFLASVAIGWRGITNKGKDAEFSKGALKELLRSSPSIATQSAKYLAEYQNFTKG